MAFTDSALFEAGIDIQGVWIHDPVDPEATVRQFLYGKASRSASITVQAQGHSYAGRVLPVYDYGDHQEDKVPVTLDVPFSDTWTEEIAALQSFAQRRQTLVLRDNRGRVVYGAMSDYSENDAAAGTSVGFTFTRVDQDVTTVVV